MSVILIDRKVHRRETDPPAQNRVALWSMGENCPWLPDLVGDRAIRNPIYGISILANEKMHLPIRIQYGGAGDRDDEINIPLAKGLNFIGWYKGSLSHGRGGGEHTPRVVLPTHPDFNYRHYRLYQTTDLEQGLTSYEPIQTDDLCPYALHDPPSLTAGVTLLSLGTPHSLYNTLRIWFDSEYYVSAFNHEQAMKVEKFYLRVDTRVGGGSGGEGK